jgi:thiol-disulfide isomerase/thioredoxin
MLSVLKWALPVALAVLVAAPRAMMSTPKKASPAELNLTDLDGRKVHLKDYRGKIVVLNFWATWCVPCKEEMPMFVSVEKQWAAKGIVFIGASLDDRAAQKNIPGFLKTFDIDFPIWKGATGDDLAKLGMGEAVPDTAFLDEEGEIVMRVLGEIKKNELLERLQWITGDRKAPSPQTLLRNL